MGVGQFKNPFNSGIVLNALSIKNYVGLPAIYERALSDCTLFVDFGEGGGIFLKDKSEDEHSFDLININNADWPGRGLIFDGSTSLAKKTISEIFSSDSTGTILSWQKTDTSGAFQGVLGTGDEASGNYWALSRINSSDYLQWAITKNGSGSRNFIDFDTATVPTNVPFFSAIRSNKPTANSYDGFLNRIKQSKTATIGLDNGDWFDTIFPNQRDNLTIGALEYNLSTITSLFSGIIYFVAYFDRTLTDEEITSFYDATRGLFSV
jgi:hypothetical protein